MKYNDLFGHKFSIVFTIQQKNPIINSYSIKYIKIDDKLG